MASTNHTENIGLCLWDETDKPERNDFLTDNIRTEAAFTEHTENNTLHLTSEEKDFVSQPFLILNILGTGTSSRVIPLNFVPRYVLYFAANRPFTQINENYVTVINGTYAAQGFNGAGLSLNGNALTVSHHLPSEYEGLGAGNLVYNLNKMSQQYCLIIIK